MYLINYNFVRIIERLSERESVLSQCQRKYHICKKLCTFVFFSWCHYLKSC